MDHPEISWDEYAECCLLHDSVTLQMILHEDMRNPLADGAIHQRVPVVPLGTGCTAPSLLIS